MNIRRLEMPAGNLVALLLKKKYHWQIELEGSWSLASCCLSFSCLFLWTCFVSKNSLLWMIVMKYQCFVQFGKKKGQHKSCNLLFGPLYLLRKVHLIQHISLKMPFFFIERLLKENNCVSVVLLTVILFCFFKTF